MKKYLSFILLISLFISCKKSSKEEITACGVANPIQNLTWLNQKVKLFTGGPGMKSITLYSYNGKEVIQIHSAVSSLSYGYQYNCEGEQLMKDNVGEINSYIANRKKISVLYGTWEGLQ